MGSPPRLGESVALTPLRDPAFSNTHATACVPRRDTFRERARFKQQVRRVDQTRPPLGAVTLRYCDPFALQLSLDPELKAVGAALAKIPATSSAIAPVVVAAVGPTDGSGGKRATESGLAQRNVKSKRVKPEPQGNVKGRAPVHIDLTSD